MDKSNFLDRFIALLDDNGIRYCVIRGQGVNAYVEPLALDPARRGSKRQKDLADIARLIESYPELRRLVPDELLKRLE